MTNVMLAVVLWLSMLAFHFTFNFLRGRRVSGLALVTFTGSAEVVANAEKTLLQVANGWARLGVGQFLVGLPQPSSGSLSAQIDSLRNFLGRQPDVEVLVVGLSGSWAAAGFKDMTLWLTSSIKRV